MRAGRRLPGSIGSTVITDEDDELGSERIEGAVLILAASDSRRFLSALALAQRDWRDVLVASGLADQDWARRLDAWLADGEAAGARRRHEVM